MLSEDYVSYEVAKLLKENGFPFMCNVGSLWVDKQGRIKLHNSFAPITWVNEDDADTPCVTQALAMKWLREEYDLHIIAYPYNVNGKKKWCCQIYKAFNLLGNEKYVNETLDSYEQAVEAALKYCLTYMI